MGAYARNYSTIGTFMPEKMQTVLAVMSDLFFSVKMNDAAKKLGMKMEFVKDKALVLEKVKAKPSMIILDLNCDAAEPLDLIARLKLDADTKKIPMIGFISHVQTDLRQKARESGCDVVLARSAFAQDLPAILERYSTGAQAPEAD
jgi:CheY-like chemotaxis protein